MRTIAQAVKRLGKTMRRIDRPIARALEPRSAAAFIVIDWILLARLYLPIWTFVACCCLNLIQQARH
jgi:hypothetical protein